MNEPIITLVGNLVADPELRFTPSGVAVCKLRVLQTPRDKTAAGEWVDGEPYGKDLTVWREFAENVAESLHRGDRVVVTGRLKARKYQDTEGKNRTAEEVEVDAIGPDLRYARTTVSKQAKAGSGPARSGGDDAWGGANAQRPAGAPAVNADEQRQSQPAASPW